MEKRIFRTFFFRRNFDHITENFSEHNIDTVFDFERQIWTVGSSNSTFSQRLKRLTRVSTCDTQSTDMKVN